MKQFDCLLYYSSVRLTAPSFKETHLLPEARRTTSDSNMTMFLGNDWSWANKWETKCSAEKLIGVVSLDFLILDDCCLDDLDIASHSSMSSSHIVVHLSNCSSQSQISVLLVHIMSSASTLVTKPDSEILNFLWRLIKDLGNVKHFTSGLFGLCQRLHIVPELRFCNDFITCEDLHPEYLWAWILSSWRSTTN